MQKWGVNYWETYAPVVNWISVQSLLLVMVISMRNNLPTMAIEFILSFPQATLSAEEMIFMELPYGFNSGENKGCVLHLKKNLYGLKQA